MRRPSWDEASVATGLVCTETMAMFIGLTPENP
jgi:hypothetical protein